MRANNGVSLSNGKVVLGQSAGDATNPALLLTDRVIPMDNHNIILSNGSLVLTGSRGDGTPQLQFEDASRGIWSQGANHITLKAGNSYLNLSSSQPEFGGVTLSDQVTVDPTARLGLLQTLPILDTGSHHMQYIKSTFAPAIGVGTFTCLGLYPVINQTGQASGITRGIYLNPTVTAAVDFRSLEITRGKSIINGPVTVNSSMSPTAGLLLGAGTASAGKAPLKFTPGTVLSTPEDGAMEYDGSDYYVTVGATQYKLSKTLSGQVTTSFGGTSLTAFNHITTTLSVAGALPGDVVNVSANSGSANPASIIVTAYVTSANTVTLQAYNASNSAVTIASDTYKVRVIK